MSVEVKVLPKGTCVYVCVCVTISLSLSFSLFHGAHLLHQFLSFSLSFFVSFVVCEKLWAPLTIFFLTLVWPSIKYGILGHLYGCPKPYPACKGYNVLMQAKVCTERDWGRLMGDNTLYLIG